MGALHGYFLDEKRDACLTLMADRLLNAEMYDMDRAKQFRRLSKALGRGDNRVNELAGNMLAKWSDEDWIVRACVKHLMTEESEDAHKVVKKQVLRDGHSIRGRTNLLKEYVDGAGVNSAEVERVAAAALKKMKGDRIADEPHSSLAVLIAFPTAEAEEILDAYYAQMMKEEDGGGRTYEQATMEVARQAVKLRRKPPADKMEFLDKWLEMIREGRGWYCSDYLFAELPELTPLASRSAIIAKIRAIDMEGHSYEVILAKFQTIKVFGGELTRDEAKEEKKWLSWQAKDAQD